MDDWKALENVVKGVEFSVVCNSPRESKSTADVVAIYSPVLNETCRKFFDDVSFGKNFRKSFRAASNYGYMGKSKGEKNGIIDIRAEDICLLEDYRRITEKFDIFGTYGCSKNAVPIKIVAHIPSGDRFIGCFDTLVNLAVIFGISNYNRSYF